MSAQRAFISRVFTPQFECDLARRYRLVRPPGDRPISTEEIVRYAEGCSHLFVSVTESISAQAIEALKPSLKVIATLSIGHEHIDITAARQHDIRVIVTPNVLSAACAEIAMMLMLNAMRRGHEADSLVRSGEWKGWAPTQLLGKGLVDRRLGILGMGRIGQEVAKRAQAFGLRIHYHNRKRLPPDLEKGAKYHADAEGLLARSDILCLTAPGTEDLAGFLDRRRIALLPNQAVVINIARGELIEDDALISALQSGHVFAAGLDVYRGEPSIDPRYAKLPNVFLSPHIGSATVETREAMGRMLLEAIDALERGERRENCIV